jgi:hypothetical protein
VHITYATTGLDHGGNPFLGLVLDGTAYRVYSDDKGLAYGWGFAILGNDFPGTATIPADPADSREEIIVREATCDPEVVRLGTRFLRSVQEGAFQPGVDLLAS